MLALGPLGTIAGHLAGSLAAGQPAGFDGGHSHLRPAVWLSVVSALAAIGWIAAARGEHPARPGVAWLAAGQTALFLVLESVERLVSGHGLGHLLAEPGLRWGLVAQVATAAGLVLLAGVARASADRVRALIAARDRPRPPATPVRPIPVVTVVVGLVAASSCRERGPPRALVSA